MSSPRRNPYSLHRQWSESVHAAHNSMPKTQKGHVVALQYLEKREALQMEDEWRAWCKQTPRELWPTWLDRWADFKRMAGWT